MTPFEQLVDTLAQLAVTPGYVPLCDVEALRVRVAELRARWRGEGAEVPTSDAQRLAQDVRRATERPATAASSAPSARWPNMRLRPLSDGGWGLTIASAGGEFVLNRDDLVRLGRMVGEALDAG
jgi:hypothetical protein